MEGDLEEKGRSDLPSSLQRPRRRLADRTKKFIMVGCGVMTLIGMALSVSRRGAHEAEPPTSQRAASAVAEEVPPPRVRLDKATLRRAAIARLEKHLNVSSPRHRRLAAMALARVSHKGAIEVLRDILQSEPSDLGRVDAAYGLAVAKEEAGQLYLQNELENERRDVRIDAARRLAQLGDDSGRKTLQVMLGIRSHRLGAAAILAQLDDERGIAALTEALSDPDTSTENRMRAAVALGRAGRDDGQELLRQILSEERYVVNAAGALARLGDQTALIPLKKQLGFTALRVEAAVGLRMLHRDDEVEELAPALVSLDPEEAITAAESILVLTEAPF